MTKPKPIIATAVTLAGLLLAIWLGMTVSGASNPLALADPGDFVRWASPIAKGVTNLAMAVTVGTLALAAWALPAGTERLKRAHNIAGLSGLAWVYYVFMVPATACLNATTLAQVGELAAGHLVDGARGNAHPRCVHDDDARDAAHGEGDVHARRTAVDQAHSRRQVPTRQHAHKNGAGCVIPPKEVAAADHQDFCGRWSEDQPPPIRNLASSLPVLPSYACTVHTRQES